MAIQGVKNVTLSQIPYLDGAILGRRGQVPSTWVEIYTVDNIFVSIIMLNKSICPDIPDLNIRVLRTSGNTSSVRVESNRVDTSVVILELVDDLLGGEVEESNFTRGAISTASNQSRIRSERC